MFDALSTVAYDMNHLPGGSNVLYVDGHVSFHRYAADGAAPVTAGVARAIGGLLRAL